MRTQKGFTLLEAMIVLVVVGAVAVISLDMLTGAAKAEARKAMVSQQATEMATLNRAVTEWVKTASGLPTTTGDILEVDLQDVIDAGRLPAEFARRTASGSNDPTSPIGQPYRAFIRRTAGAAYEVAVMPLGSLNPGFAARAGISSEPESLRVFNVAVMQEIRSKFTLPSGVINQGTSAIDSAASGFTIDLGAFLGGNASDMTVAALSNFAELATIAADEDEVSYIGKTCRVTTNTCATDEVEAGKVTACERWGAQFVATSPLSEIVVSPVGNIVVDRLVTVEADYEINNSIPYINNVTNRITTQISGGTIVCRDTVTNFSWTCCPTTTCNFDGAIGPGQNMGSVSASSADFAASSFANGNSSSFINIGATNRAFVPSGNSHGWQISVNRVTSNAVAQPSKAVCTGSRATQVDDPNWVGLSVPTPIWRTDISFERVYGSTSYTMYPIPGNTLDYAAFSPAINGGGSGIRGTRGALFSERITLPGSTPVTIACERARIDNAGTMSLAIPGGTGFAYFTNACASTSVTGFSIGSGRGIDTFVVRRSQAALGQTRICCK